jgi:hypothetical protein
MLLAMAIALGASASSCSREGGGAPAGGASSQVSRGRLAATDSCSVCEAQICDPQGVGCDGLTGAAQATCQAAVSCIKASGCAIDGDASSCYCGTASQDDGSCAAAPLGVCIAELEAADPNILPTDTVTQRFNKVATDFVDPTLPIGRATGLIGCDAFSCGGVCMFPEGKGGTSGGGGASAGNGGASGSAGGSGGGSGLGGGGGGGMGGGGGTSDTAACVACEAQICAPQGAGCDGLTGAPQAACQAAVSCIKATGCSNDGDTSYCYCGTASQDDGTCARAPLGVCIAELVAADPNILPTDSVIVRFNKIAADLVDSTLPIGKATGLIGCDAFSCSGVCVVSGSGGGSGTGGVSGSGGATTCPTCEAQRCAPFGVGCDGLTGAAQSACQTALSCMQSSGCALGGDASYCYCGTASQDEEGCGAAPPGACVAELEAADPNILPTDTVTQRFDKIAHDLVDSSLPIGAATGLLGCDAFNCSDVCVVAGSGGSGGGGASGGAGGSDGGGGLGGGGGGGTGGAATSCEVCESSFCVPQGVRGPRSDEECHAHPGHLAHRGHGSPPLARRPTSERGNAGQRSVVPFRDRWVQKPHPSSTSRSRTSASTSRSERE